MAKSSTAHHRPPPRGTEGRGYVSPLGGATSPPQILQGGGSSGRFTATPMRPGAGKPIGGAPGRKGRGQ
jgi:hypothetical protein